MKRVVITGLGAVTPIGNNVTDYFDGLANGKVGIDYITKFDADDLKVKIAAEVKNFDPSLYLEVPEIKKLDLFSQYAIATSDQAVKDSGIAERIDPSRFGIYMGSGIGGITTINSEAIKCNDGGSAKVSANFIPMTIINIASGLIAIRHKAQGPNMAVVTACASGASCIGEAYLTIKLGRADAIIAGGTEATVSKLAMAGFQNMFALTRRNDPSCASIPFDKRRDGFVLGEGSGALILEELEHALKRGARIYAEVVGYGNTCDAHHVTAPAPDGNGASRAMLLASEQMKDSDSVYINAHGTSTPLNDKTETAAIKAAFGDRAYKMLISSTKSMTGHTLGAAGAIEAIASVMAVYNGVVPPTMNYSEKDEECDLDYVPNKARRVDIDFALSNSFGFGGQNAALGFRKYKYK